MSELDDILNQWAPAEPARKPAPATYARVRNVSSGRGRMRAIGTPGLLVDEEEAPVDANSLLDQWAPPEKPGMLEAAARGVGQAASLGFGDEIVGGLESAFTDKSYTQARDESRENNRRAREAHPIAYGAGEVGGALATSAIPGGALLRGAGLARAGLQGAALGAASAAGSSEADLTKGEVLPFAQDVAVGGAIGGALGAATGGGLRKAASAVMEAAPARAAKQFTQDMTEGAIPTIKKRFAKLGDLAREVLEPDTQFVKAARRAPEQAAEIAESRLDDLGAQVRPLWKTVDREVGKVPVKELTGWMENAANEVAQSPGEEVLRDLLLKKSKDFAASVEAAGMDPETAEVPHQFVRTWVTRLLKSKDSSIGSLAEHERYSILAEVHDVADDYLRTRLEAARTAAPHIGEKIDELLAANRKIAAYANAEQLMKHKGERASWKPTGAAAALDRAAAGHRGTASAVGAAFGNLPGFLTGMAADVGVQVGAKAIKGADRKITQALAQMVERARAGDKGAQSLRKAIEEGVPETTARAVLSAARVGYNEALSSKQEARP